MSALAWTCYTIATLLTLGPGVYLLFTRHLMRAVFAMLLSFLGVALLFLLAAAEFLAVVQLMIYVGGVLVLLVFGLMWMWKPGSSLAVEPGHNRLRATLAVVATGGVLYQLLLRFSAAMPTWLQQGETLTGQSPSLRLVGIHLLSTHLVALELAGLLLTTVLVGVAWIASATNNG